ncbi:hypothetical protein BJ741DRAFT_680273 [Chytriomyces cf. hyalinus JEL632]|nr:hypothetical protein BJ741DRAFT_680273 [Chytriomyces cf. hyalinus JEL632]
MINPPVVGNITYADYDRDLLDTQWNAVTIVVSVAISYAGAMYTILLNEARCRIDPPVSKFYSAVLLLLSSLSLSIRAIFFMHFVGMTAVTLHIHETGTRVPIYFDYGYTVLSAVVCSLTILWAFHYASQDEYWNSIVHDRTKLAERIMAREVAKTMAIKKKAEKKLNQSNSKSGKSLAPGSQSVSAVPPRTSGVTRSMGARDSNTHAHMGHEIKATAEFDNQMEAIVESTALLPQRDNMLSPHVQPLHPESAQNSARRLSAKDAGTTNSGSKDDSKSGDLVHATPPHTPQPHTKSPRNWIAKGWESLPRPQLPPPHLPQIPINYPSADASIRYDVGPAFPSRDRPKESSTQLDSIHFGSGGGGDLELTIDILILFEKPWRIVISGFFIAIAVLAMHHLGMYSMRMQADQIFNPVIVGLSVVIAVVAATAGMFIIFRILPYYPYEVVKYTAAVIIAIAVNGMHYTGMAAVNYTFKHVPDFDPSGFIEPIHLAEVILYSEVIINIVSEAVLRQDNDLVLNLYRARAQAAFGTPRGSYVYANSSRRPSFIPV